MMANGKMTYSMDLVSRLKMIKIGIVVNLNLVLKINLVLYKTNTKLSTKESGVLETQFDIKEICT